MGNIMMMNKKKRDDEMMMRIGIQKRRVYIRISEKK
jgi:hypothetical protein